MRNYARNHIPNYNTITNIPEEHSPNSINTSLAQNWSNTFANCRNIINLPDPFYDTNNATNMSRMFAYCNNLTTVPNFDTSNVTNMTYMFINCHNLTTVPNFDTSNVTNMGRMFYNCHNLTTVPNFDTSNVTDMKCMFYSCNNLTTVPILDTINVTSMYDMFLGCTNIQGNFYISSNNIINIFGLFHDALKYTKNIYCHTNTITYNSIYYAMGNNTYNSRWNSYLKTMENDYAEIIWSGNGIYRFPTNKIMTIWGNDESATRIIEVSPYTDYNLLLELYDIGAVYLHRKDDNMSTDPSISQGGWIKSEFAPENRITFRFFKDITNMTPDIVDTI